MTENKAPRTPKNIIESIPGLFNNSATAPTRVTGCILKDVSMDGGKLTPAHMLKDGFMDGGWAELSAEDAQKVFEKLDAWIRKKGIKEAKEYENELVLALWEKPGSTVVAALDGGGMPLMADELLNVLQDLELADKYESSSNIGFKELPL